MRNRHAVAGRRIDPANHTKVLVTVVVDSPTGRTSQVEVEAEGYERWLRGAHVQDAFPSLPAEQREILVTGIGPEEWREMFGDGEE